MVIIDGCPVGCAKAVLKQAQVPLKNYLVVTGEGIESGNLNLSRADIERVKAAIKRVVSGQASSDIRPFAGSCGCASCSTDKADQKSYAAERKSCLYLMHSIRTPIQGAGVFRCWPFFLLSTGIVMEARRRR